MNVKELFDAAEGGTLTYEQFAEAAKAKNAKFTDLSEGKYVSKQKYDDDLAAKDTQIETLNGTISTRDTDLEGLKKQLEAAGTDAAKLTELNGSLTNLQTKYDKDIKEYKDKLSKQAYEFAVKEFAAGKKFTSNAAKRDFINSMTQAGLKLDGGSILGAEDFVTKYSVDNADAFVVETPPEDNPPVPKPKFVDPTNPPAGAGDNGTGAFNFNFTGVRPRPQN